MKRRYRHTIISNSIDECSELISRVGRDEKTGYIDGDCFEIGTDFQVKHIVGTDHNVLNFKRKYNQYEIEL